MTIMNDTPRRRAFSACQQNGLTEAELFEAVAWVRRHRQNGLSDCERFCDDSGYSYLSVYDDRGEEAFLFGRQEGKCFADRLWTFSTLAEGNTSADVLASLDELYQTRH